MPTITARRLCPHGIFLRPRMEAYRAESRQIMGIVRDQAGDLIQQVSIDEAYTDVSARHQGETADASLERALPLARSLKTAILAARQLTVSIGIAPNKLLAKLASDHQKPDGLTLIRESEKVEFLKPLPVRALHGVGKITEEHLHRAGLHTIEDLQNHPGDLRAIVGAWGTELRRFAFGIDERPLEVDEEVKSISSENTFARDTEDRPTLRTCLKGLAEDVAHSLGQHRLAARTVQVKIRYGDFTTLTRQISLEEPLTEARDLFRLGCWLLARERLVSRPLRLLGLGVSGLVEVRASQLHLPFGN